MFEIIYKLLYHNKPISYRFMGWLFQKTANDSLTMYTLQICFLYINYNNTLAVNTLVFPAIVHTEVMFIF